MSTNDTERVSTWGSVPFGSSHIQIRHIVFWIGLIGWFALTLVVANVHSITAFAFNLAFLINLIIVSIMVRSAHLTRLTACFCAGGFIMGLLVLASQPLQLLFQSHPLIRPFITVPLEEIGRALPVLYLLWQGRRFHIWTLGATDMLLLGAASGAGFGFVEDAYFNNLNQSVTHFFVLVPNVDVIQGHLSCGAAVWGAIVFGCVGLGLVQIQRLKLLGALTGLGIVVALADHLAINYSQIPNNLSWLTTTLNAVTGNGYVAIVFFALVVIACLIADIVMQLSSLPKAPEFKVARLKDRNERLDQLWDAMLDFRRLAYANFRLKHWQNQPVFLLNRSDLALTVSLLSKRLINRHFNTETPIVSPPAVPSPKPEIIYVDDLPLIKRLDLPERYQVLEEVGNGGMGVIYKGKHRGTGADLAIKVLHPRYASNSGHLMRFEQEARTATTLHHPNIVIVHDFGVTERLIPFLVMEWLEGPNMESVMKTGTITLNRFVHIFEQCASALSHSHKKGIIHRDVKPSNIILTSTEADRDFVKIVDFGIAKVLTSDDEDTLRLTQTGEVLGSPKYMSPEQCMGNPMDSRSDIYSLGCVMYESLVGVAPLTADNQAQMFYKHMFNMPERPSLINPNLELPEIVEPILFKALQKDPDKRFTSMDELLGAINQIKSARSA